MADVTAPDGCRFCEVPQPNHSLLWHGAAGWHRFIAPFAAQRQARITNAHKETRRG